MARSPEEVVTDFCQAWSRLDLDELMTYFTDESIYHNIPTPAIHGKGAIRESLGGFLPTCTGANWEILNVASSGNVVFTERVDRLDVGDKHVDLPVNGVFQVEGEHILAWRDYFDMAMFTSGLA